MGKSVNNAVGAIHIWHAHQVLQSASAWGAGVQNAKLKVARISIRVSKLATCSSDVVWRSRRAPRKTHNL